MATLLRASATISAGGVRRAATGSNESRDGLAYRKDWTISTGAGCCNFEDQRTVTIAKSSSYTLDLASFTDTLGDSVVLAKLKTLLLSHDSASVATAGVSISGAAGNALPGVRASDLKAGQVAMPFFDPTTAGLVITAPNSKIVIDNADTAQSATVTILIQGDK